jgi:hypothetical protein
VDEPFEPVAMEALVAPTGAGGEVLQMLERQSTQPPGQLGIALAIGVEKGVARRGLRPTNGLQPCGDETQVVADIVQVQPRSQLCVEQTHRGLPRQNFEVDTPARKSDCFLSRLPEHFFELFEVIRLNRLPIARNLRK